MKAINLNALFVLLVFGLLSTDASGTGNVTQSLISQCTVNELGSECQDKQVTRFDVSHGLQATVDLVVEVGGGALEETLHIEAEKSVPVLSFPLRYLHRVPYYPYTEVKEQWTTCPPVPGTGTPLACVDGRDAADPTCGFVFDGGVSIEDSQGGCSGHTARCMRPDQLYFDGYEILRYRESFDVDIKLSKGAANQQFTLTPMEPVRNISNNDFNLHVELGGDSGEYQGVPALENYILYIPAAPESHPFVQDYQNNMLLVPREEVTVDGSECNKVGVGFKAYREWARSSAFDPVPPQYFSIPSPPPESLSCLDNQLYHKHNLDLQVLVTNPDAETRYLVSGMRTFKDAMDFRAGMPQALRYRIDDIHHTELALVTDAATVKTIRTESLGAIDQATVTTFPSMAAAGKQAGLLEARVTNWGSLKTDYVVKVTNCSANIEPAIPAQARILEPFEQATLTFYINTLYNQATANNCLVTLESPTGRFYDSENVSFNTLEYQPEFSWDQRQENEGTEYSCAAVGGTIGDFNGDSCVDRMDYRTLLYAMRGGADDPRYDLNGDGVLNIYDLRELVQAFDNPGGQSCTSP